MRSAFPSRLMLYRMIAAALFLLAPARNEAQRAPFQGFHPAQAPQRVAPPRNNQNNQEHLGPWLDRHRTLSPQQQQRALEQEPGFRQLAPQTQQRMRDRLNQLNSMNPQQRQRTLQHAEEMENLNPQQRQQVRGAMSQLGQLPPDRRQAVARAFRQLRAMPPAQRQMYINSGVFARQLSPGEQGTLQNLMSVEPLLPPQRPAQGQMPIPMPPPQ